MESCCCPGHSKNEFRPFLTHRETLLTLSVHVVRLCQYWMYICTWLRQFLFLVDMEWDSAYTVFCVHGVRRLCLYWVYVEWDSACTESKWSETLLTLSVCGVRLCLRRVYSTWCETLLMLSVHRVRLCLYWVYMEWEDSANAECTIETLVVPSVHGVRRLCLYWVYME